MNVVFNKYIQIPEGDDQKIPNKNICQPLQDYQEYLAILTGMYSLRFGRANPEGSQYWDGFPIKSKQYSQ